MGKRHTEKQRAGPEVSARPNQVIVESVEFLGVGLVLGGAQVIFKLPEIPGADVILCLGEAGMVGFAVRGEVTSRALQRIPLRTLERYAISEAAAIGRGRGGRPGNILFKWVSTPVPPLESSREADLASLAARYLELCGESRRPTKLLAEELYLAVGTVRDRLAEARRRGLLLSVGPGRAGGELTPRARMLLSTDDEA